MGWSISLIENTVILPEPSIIEIEIWSRRFFTGDDLVYKNKLVFYDDHMEHMDYLHEPELQDILRKYKVSGMIKFGSLDGDNAGEYWGYNFQDGICSKIKGEIIWK